jgi:ankyrin repeat protein
MPLLLPPNPSLRHLRLQVDDLMEAFAAGQPDAARTTAEYLPQVLPERALKRAQAQHVVARQYGFESWPKLKHYVDAGAERVEVESLCAAVKHRDLDAVRSSLANDPSLVEGMMGWGMTPLYCAARWGTTEAVKLLLEHGADPNVRQGAPLFDCRNLESLRLMLEHGGDASLLHDDHAAHRMSLLHVAARRDDVDMLEVVLSHGAEVHLNGRLAAGNEGRCAGQTPLQVAAKAECRRVAKALIARGADYDLFSAACLGDTVRVDAARTNDYRVLKAVDTYGGTVLHWAVEAVQADVARRLLDAGADVNAENQFGETPLLLSTTHDAHSADRRSLAPLLVASGARVDVLAAAAMGDVARLRDAHLRDPESIHAKSRNGWTALHWAARNGHAEAVRALIDWGCDVNAADEIGWTPVFPAAYWGQRVEVVRLLAERGADLEHRDKFQHPLTDYDVGPDVWEVLRDRKEAKPSSAH